MISLESINHRIFSLISVGNSVVQEVVYDWTIKGIIIVLVQLKSLGRWSTVKAVVEKKTFIVNENSLTVFIDVVADSFKVTDSCFFQHVLVGKEQAI